MKTEHATQLRKGIREARNLLWFHANDTDKLFMRQLYHAAIKRSTSVSYKAFKRTLERAGLVN